MDITWLCYYLLKSQWLELILLLVKSWYFGSFCLDWNRTGQLDGGHVEFCRGIENPIGIKCGPTLKADDLINLCNRIIQNEKGKIALISRFGADNVSKFLPRLIKELKKGLNVIWSCDPCHGNTIKAATGFKTRPFNSVLK